MEKKLTVPRQKKLKKEFPNGEAVGRAFVQFYLDRKRKIREINFKPTLTIDEINFLIKYEHVYYHGLFRDLSVIQTPDYDIQIYHFIKSKPPILPASVLKNLLF